MNLMKELRKKGPIIDMPCIYKNSIYNVTQRIGWYSSATAGGHGDEDGSHGGDHQDQREGDQVRPPTDQDVNVCR